MNRFSWLIIILFIGFGIAAKAQKPLPPLNDSIHLTIDLDNGNPTIFWAPPLPDPLYPNPTGYIIYKRVVDIFTPLGRNEPIDTVPAGVHHYTDLLSNGNNERLTYLIASNGPTPSQFSSVHSSIFITSRYDSCNKKMEIKWNNANYQGWGNRIKKYDVYVGNDNNWAAYPLYTSLPGTSTRFTITNVVENRDYFVYIAATKDTTGEPGWIPYVSKSNLLFKNTTMPVHPASMTIDSILAEDDRTNLFFKIDPSTGLNNFQIVRWEDADSVKSIFSKKILTSFTDRLTTSFTDTEDNWAARTRPFYYKIDALNSCPTIVKVSNHANSITPNVVAEDGMKNRIEWDALFIDTAIDARKSNYARYRVTRFAYKTAPMPPVFLPETDQLEQIDDVSALAGETDPFSIKFCYQIEAFEYEGDPVRILRMYSQSRIQCVEIVPGVTMPDAIIPNDLTSGFGNSRNILAPIITFKADYSLYIYNRWGSLIFTGENKGWNGYTSNGRLANEGSYIYRLIVHTLGNRDVIKEGSFVVVYK